MVNFEEFNKTANYYTSASRNFGHNVWDQDDIQRKFIELIVNCNLTKEQRDSLKEFIVSNNATIDMEPTKNNSVNEFNDFIKSNEDVIEKSMIV